MLDKNESLLSGPIGPLEGLTEPARKRILTARGHGSYAVSGGEHPLSQHRINGAGAFFGSASVVPSEEPPLLVAHHSRCAEPPPTAAPALAARQLVRSK